MTDRLRQTPFARALAAIAVLALGVRLAYWLVHRGSGIQGDALTFWVSAGHLADGEGFRRVFEDVPTAEHPPGHIVLLAAQRLALGLRDYEDAKPLLCLVGTATVVLVALVARRIAGDRAGLLAGLGAALYPNLVNVDASLMSEGPYLTAIAGVLLLALRARDRSSVGRYAALGAAIMLAAYLRSEAIALLGVLVVPMAWHARRTLPLAGAAIVTALLLLAPWTIRNLQTFEEPVVLSTNGYGVFTGANCERTYSGDVIGSWVFSCFGETPAGDESEQSVVYRDRGLRYAVDHADRWPVVVAARAGRMLEVYRPRQSVFFQGVEGRSEKVAWAGILAFWGLLPAALYGLVVVRRRRGPTWVLAAPVVMSIAVCLLVYGSTRLRVAAEPSLLVLGAIAVDQLLRRGRPASPPARSPAA